MIAMNNSKQQKIDIGLFPQTTGLVFRLFSPRHDRGSEAFASLFFRWTLLNIGKRNRSKPIPLSVMLFLYPLSIACCLFFLGCGGPSAPTLSSIHTMAIEYNQKGMKAVEKGDYEKALGYYMEALKINRSVENTEGIAVNLINIAAIYYKKGNTFEAHEFIDMAFPIPDINYDIKSEAAFEKARLHLKEKEVSKAKEWANRSLSLNKGIREGSRWNLLGRVALMEGRYDESLAIANTALKLNRENKQRIEEANSLRLIAEISAQTDRYEESREFYMRALEIDKESGNGKKIAMSLRGLGELSLKYGHLQDAINFYMRAYNVSSNADDIEGALAAIESLSDAYKKSGDEKNAEEILKKKSDLEKK